MNSIIIILALVALNSILVLSSENATTTTDNILESNLVPQSNISSSSEFRDPEQIEEAANTMFKEYWEIVLLDNPETATTLGDHRFDDRLTSYSLKCYDKRKVVMNEFLERANQMLPLAPEGSNAQVNIQLFITVLQFKLDQLMNGAHLFPVSQLYTPQMALRYLLKYTKLNDAQSYWNLLSRYRAVPKQIDEQIELMREGIRTNFTLSDRSLFFGGVDRNQSVEDSPFYEPFSNISASIPPEEIEAIQINATDVIKNILLPAFDKMANFMEDEYLSNVRPDIGVSSLPNGRDFYQHELSYHLTDTSVTPEEIHRKGLEEVDRISREMDEVIRSLGFNMTRKEFADFLRNDESQFFATEDEALETYRHVLEKEITPKLPLLFKNIPRMKLTVEKIPKDISSGPRAYYMSASPDNSTPATFYLDTSSIGNLPRYEVMTLAIHEGVPGHHFQISYAMEQTDLPEFRKYEINSNAFVEGWALYAEYLGYEMGLYEDLYMMYGHLSEEIFRACRMVVDTGMHVMGWTRQEAINYMLENSAATLNNIEREVDRYITWPGQACSYKYGELKIKELRKKAESELGGAFDIKEFHDVILRNNGPLEQVAKQIDRYIAASRDSSLRR